MPQTLRPTDELIVKTRQELRDLNVAYSQLQQENERLVKENGHLAVENNRLRDALEEFAEADNWLIWTALDGTCPDYEWKYGVTMPPIEYARAALERRG